MNKPYIFLQDSYQDLQSLSQAYIAHFDEGMQDIYSNTKELIRFIRSRINDKATIHKYIEILSETKYKSNALTFLIFEMSGHKDIIIGGVRLDLLNYLQALRENPDPANNILFGFLEDRGLSKVYKVAGADPKLCAHSEAIEKNFRNPFTYTYLTSYYGYENKESLNAKVRQIAINGEECFRRFTKLANQEAFLNSLAHIAGFTETIEAVKDVNPAFVALKLMKKETEEEYLRKIVHKSYFWWMLEDDNFNKYEYKGKASRILKKYVELKHEYDHYYAQIEAKKISAISFDKYIDMSRELYVNYLCFVSAYHNNLIEIKKKYNPESYAPDKAYNKTYICQEFMQGKICKLYSPGAKASGRINPLTGEVIEDESATDFMDDVSDDKPELILPEDKKIELDVDLKKKKLKQQYGYSYIAVVFGMLSLIPAGFMVAVVKFLNTGFFASIAKNYSIVLATLTIYALFAAYGFVFLIAGITMKRNKKAQYALHRYSVLTHGTEPKDLLEEERILFEQEKDHLYKKAKKTFTFSSFLVEAFLGVLCAFIAIFGTASVTAILPSFGKFSSMANGYGLYLTLAFGMLLGIVFGCIFQKKKRIGAVLFIFFATFLCALFLLVV